MVKILKRIIRKLVILFLLARQQYYYHRLLRRTLQGSVRYSANTNTVHAEDAEYAEGFLFVFSLCDLYLLICVTKIQECDARDDTQWTER